MTTQPPAEQEVLRNVKVDFCVTSKYWMTVESAEEDADCVMELAFAFNALVEELP